MISGSKVANKHQKVQLKKKDGGESDEDYMVEVDDEFDDSDVEYPYSLDNEFEDKEEDIKKVKRIGRPRGKRSCPRRDKNGVSYREEGEDSDCNDSDEDEEFRPDEIGGDEELPFMKKSKVNRLSAKRKIQKRKQITEAREIFKSSTTDSRSSSLVKEKERMVGMKVEEGKQVCGICLSEEGKTTVRGKLNSCSHYFCFPCIMEWSKVESRCPLCKQRFTAITRIARIADEHTSAGVTVPIPELDQVYQPSAEELRRYLDPYEDFVCTECNEGGDTQSCFSVISVIHLHTLIVLVLVVKYQKEIGIVLFVGQPSLLPQMSLKLHIMNPLCPLHLQELYRSFSSCFSFCISSLQSIRKAADTATDPSSCWFSIKNWPFWFPNFS